MATWSFHGWVGGTPVGLLTSHTVHPSAMGISSASALSFGGTDRFTYAANISIDNWNSSMHYASSTLEGTNDLCDVANAGGHLNALTPPSHITDGVSTSTGFALNSIHTDNFTASTPNPIRGLGLYFVHGSAVRCNPVTIWGGTQVGVDQDPENCTIAIVDLSTSVRTWSSVAPGRKKTLRLHDTAATEHLWTVGIGVRPRTVGHSGNNKIKIECTYY